MPKTREKLIEVKKALEFCFKQGMTSDCNGCAYKGYEGGVCMDALMEDALAVIKQLENKEPVQEWISVKDRLPEPNKLVLCWWESGDGEREHYGFATFQSHGVWYVSNEGMPEVTHWMPLPQPPKGE